MILADYNLNPILMWEIILRQKYDKVFKIDENTILYNIEIQREDKMTKKHLYKIIHLIDRDIMFILSTASGLPTILTMFEKLLRFEEVKRGFSDDGESNKMEAVG